MLVALVAGKHGLVVAGAAIERVVALAADQRVITIATQQRIAAAAGLDEIVVACSDPGVGMRAAAAVDQVMSVRRQTVDRDGVGVGDRVVVYPMLLNGVVGVAGS